MHPGSKTIATDRLAVLEMKVFIVAVLVSLFAVINCQTAEERICFGRFFTDAANPDAVSAILRDCSDIIDFEGNDVSHSTSLLLNLVNCYYSNQRRKLVRQCALTEAALV